VAELDAAFSPGGGVGKGKVILKGREAALMQGGGSDACALQAEPVQPGKLLCTQAGLQLCEALGAKQRKQRWQRCSTWQRRKHRERRRQREREGGDDVGWSDEQRSRTPFQRVFGAWLVTTVPQQQRAVQ
jgi:hypothetical protein